MNHTKLGFKGVQKYEDLTKSKNFCGTLLHEISFIGRNPFNQNFRAEVRKFLGVEWIATSPNGLVPFHSENEFHAHLKWKMLITVARTISTVKSLILCELFHA